MLEQAGFGKRVFSYETFCFCTIVGVDDDNATMAACAVVVRYGAARKYQVLLVRQVFQMCGAIVAPDILGTGFVFGLNCVWNL